MMLKKNLGDYLKFTKRFHINDLTCEIMVILKGMNTFAYIRECLLLDFHNDWLGVG